MINSTANSLTETDTQRPTVLCVDDDPDVTRFIKRLLSNYDLNVVCESCGRLAILDIFQNRPDVIITDLRMPDGDGRHLLNELANNSQTASIPVIVLTGLRGSQLPRRIRHRGAIRILHKPVHYETLLAEIECFVPLRPCEWAAAEESGERAAGESKR